MDKTIAQYNHVIEICKDIFLKKMIDYGPAWRILRPVSLTDQIFIKAKRIREIEINGITKIDEGMKSEFIGIINYAIIALIQLEIGFSDVIDIDNSTAESHYNNFFEMSKELMSKKNHDYGEAWRSMRISSFTDLILMKLYRTKQIEDNQGKTLISEGVDANYYDMINYAVFAVIKMNEADSNV